MTEPSPTRHPPINKMLGTLALTVIAAIGVLIWRAYEKSFEYQIDVCTGDVTVDGSVIQLEKAERDIIIKSAKRSGLSCETVTRTLKHDERENARVLSRYQDAAAWIAYDQEVGDYFLREITQTLHRPGHFDALHTNEISLMVGHRRPVKSAPDRIELQDANSKAIVPYLKSRIGAP